MRWQALNNKIEAVGTSRARQSITLFPEVSGEVTAVNFSAGDWVEQGETLLQMDDRDEHLALRLAKVQLTDSERLYQRYQRTEGAGAVTANTLDEAESALQQARIQVQRAQLILDDHAIKAPFSGFMGLTDVDPGAQITPSTAIASIDDRQMLYVTFDLPEVYYGQVKTGQAVALSTWSNNGPQYQAHVYSIDSRIDNQSRTFAVRAEVDNREDQLRPGMSFKVELSLSDGRYPAVPEVALQWGGDGAFVWAVIDGQSQRVSASVVQRQQGIVLVDAKLDDGALVVTEGIQRLRPGLKVKESENQNPAHHSPESSTMTPEATP